MTGVQTCALPIYKELSFNNRGNEPSVPLNEFIVFDNFSELDFTSDAVCLKDSDVSLNAVIA